MPFNLGIDLTGGIATIQKAFAEVTSAVEKALDSADPDIKRRCELMILYAAEAPFYALYNGVADLTGQPKLAVPGPLPDKYVVDVPVVAAAPPPK